MTDELRRRIIAALEHLDGWQLEAVDRLARSLDHSRGYGNPPFVLGLGRLELHDSIVRGTVEIGSLHLNPHGVAHGMVPFGLVDNAMGQVVATSGDTLRNCVAVEVKIQFVRPLRPGTARIEGEAVHVGRRIAIATAKIWNESGELAVLATGTYYMTQP